MPASCVWTCLLILAWLTPGLVLALGLGRIQVYSHLGQPLRADIQLLAIPPDTVGQVHAALASPEDFDWIGLQRDRALEDLAFTPLINSKGRPVIRVTSTRPVTRPGLDLLLDVRWSGRHLLREYAIEIKPLPRPTAPAASVRPAKLPTRTRAPVGTPAKTPTTAPQPALQAILTGEAGRYRTVPGDTLSGIARRYAPQGAAQWHRMTQALYAANPHAFLHGDINRLMTGVVLKIPQGEELARLGRPHPESPAMHRTAPAPVTVTAPSPTPPQRRKPQETDKADKPPPGPPSGPDNTARGKPHLEILGKERTEAPAAVAVASSKEYLAKLERTVTLAQELAESRLQEANELKSRIRALEGVIAKQDRLITLQSEQLSKLIERSEAPKPSAARPSTTVGLWLLGTLVGLTVVLAVLVLRLYLRK